MTSDIDNTGPVSTKETWDQYYSEKVISDASLEYFRPLFKYMNTAKLESGDLFELGCGCSGFLALGAKCGWRVGGIDYCSEGIDLIKRYLKDSGYSAGTFYDADLFTFDWSLIRESIDVIVSFGFLEHFTNSDEVLTKACIALRPGGTVISQIPNLFSFNAKLLRRFDRNLWDQHVPYTKEQFDEIHKKAGLQVLTPAHYGGGYDQFMLIPWTKIQDRLPRILFKILRYMTSFILQPLMRLLPKTGSRIYCASIIGVYRKPLDI